MACDYLGYCDWAAAMQRQPLDFRYSVMAGLLSDDELEENGLNPEIEGNEFVKARWKTAERVKEYLSSKVINGDELSRKTTWSKSLISHMKVGRKPFNAPSRSWETLAYDHLHISIHNLLFGEDRDLLLPSKYGIPASLMMQLPEADQLRLQKLAQNAFDQYDKSVEEIAPGHHRSIVALLRERLTDVREHYGYTKYQSFGPDDTPNTVKSVLTLFWYGEDTDREPKYAFLMYAALALREQNADWLLAEDALRGYCDVYIQDENGERIALTGPAKDFIRNVIRVDEDTRKELMTQLWGQVHKNHLES